MGNLRPDLIVDKKTVYKKEIKYLSIILDSKLNYLIHLNYLENKVISLINTIKRLSWMNNSIKLDYKLRLYYNIFLAIIWF